MAPRGLSAALLVLGIALRACALAPAFAHAGDDSEAAWYRDLKRPDTGGSCCSHGGQSGDCDVTEYRIKDGVYIALAPTGEWVEVPRERILERTPNPTGRAVLCYNKSLGGVLCFVRESET